MQQQLLSEKPDDPDRMKALGDTLTQLGQVWTRKQNHKAASAEYDEVVKIRERLAARFPDNTEYQRTLASAYMNAGLPAFNLAEMEPDDKVFDQLIAKAKDQFAKMQDVRQRLLARDDLGPQFRREVKRDLGMGAYNLGRLARLEERLNVAITEYLAAAASFEEVLQDDPADLENQRRLALCRRLVGDLFRISGELPEARKSYELGLQRLERLVKENPDVGEYEWLRAGILLVLYALDRDENNASAARLAAAERARDAYRALAEKYQSVAVYQRDLAIALRELANEKRAAGQPKEATEDLQEAIRILTELVKSHPEQVEYADSLREIQETAQTTAAPTN